MLRILFLAQAKVSLGLGCLNLGWIAGIEEIFPGTRYAVARLEDPVTFPSYAEAAISV